MPCRSLRGIPDCGHDPTPDEPICWACARTDAREEADLERRIDREMRRLRAWPTDTGSVT